MISLSQSRYLNNTQQRDSNTRDEYRWP